MLKKIFSLLLLLLLPLNVYATMDPAQWRREILIGSDHDNFYTYEINYSQPGSYYEKKESTNFLIYNKNTGTVKQKIPLRIASYVRDQETNLWKANVHNIKKVDLSIYYQGKTFEWFFPQDNFILSKLKINDKGLIIKTKNGEKLINYKIIPKYIFNLFYEEEHPRIVAVYGDSTNLYILAQRGMSSEDANYMQEILLIDRKKYAAARSYKAK